MLGVLAAISWPANLAAVSAAQVSPTEPAIQSTQPARQPTAAALTPILATPAATPFPEYLTNKDQTNGVVLASTVLVLIILIGTLTVMRTSERLQRR